MSEGPSPSQAAPSPSTPVSNRRLLGTGVGPPFASLMVGADSPSLYVTVSCSPVSKPAPVKAADDQPDSPSNPDYYRIRSTPKKKHPDPGSKHRNPFVGESWRFAHPAEVQQWQAYMVWRLLSEEQQQEQPMEAPLRLEWVDADEKWITFFPEVKVPATEQATPERTGGGQRQPLQLHFQVRQVRLTRPYSARGCLLPSGMPELQGLLLDNRPLWQADYSTEIKTAAKAGSMPTDRAQADLWRLKCLLATVAHHHVDPALVQAVTEAGHAAWAVFFFDWAPQTGPRQGHRQCLCLRNTAALPKLGAWMGERGYVAIVLGSRVAEPEQRALSGRVVPAKVVPATTYLHRLLCWARNGPMPAGHEVDHECQRPGCVAAGCLQWVTHKQNTELVKGRRQLVVERQQAAATDARLAAAGSSESERSRVL